MASVKGSLTAAITGVAMATMLLGSVPSAQAATRAPVADVIVTQPFLAHSGDACMMGFTRGTLGWYPGPLRVDIVGTVADRPLPSEPTTACGEDGRYSVATFTAFATNGGQASVAVRADNGQRAFSVPLRATTRIELIVVQVCRHSPLPGPASYCGPAQRYLAPLITAGQLQGTA
jgi:hypothetical protein